jgi:diguanylate cyclase (GGDEF)-like protein
MNELNKKRNRKIEGPEKLIIIMIVIVAGIGLLINEIEVKLICAILFVIGGFILFMSFSGKAKEIVKEEEVANPTPNPIKQQTEINTNRSGNQSFSQKKLVFDDSGAVSVDDENEFFIVKSISNGKNQNLGMNNRNHKNSEKVNEGSKFFDIDFFKLAEGKDPKTEFSIILNSILSNIKEVTFANTTAFFWVNLDKKTIIFESGYTNSEQFNLKPKDSLALGVNLIGRVALKAKAEIVSNINADAEKDLLGYYESTEYVRSIIGIPICFDNFVVGVLTVDSKEEDNYGQETVSILSQFVNLISVLIKTSTEKYDYYVDSLVLNKIEMLNQNLRDDFNLTNLMNHSLKVISEIFDWDNLTFCFFDNAIAEWRVDLVVSKDESCEYVRTHCLIDTGNSILGNIIKDNKFALIPDLSKIPAPRFNKDEGVSKAGSFMAMPIYSNSKIYGAITVESKKPNLFNFDDAGILNKFCSAISNLLEIASLKEYIIQKITIDDVTNLPNRECSLTQLNSMIEWIRDYNDFGMFILLSVDRTEELKNRFGESGLNTILVSLVQILNSNKESYHLFGKYGENIFGLFLLHYTLDEGKVFAEKIRKNIASNIINFQNRSFSVTVSIGAIELNRYQTTSDAIDGALKVLKIACEEGGNRVKIL